MERSEHKFAGRMCPALIVRVYPFQLDGWMCNSTRTRGRGNACTISAGFNSGKTRYVVLPDSVTCALIEGGIGFGR